MVRTTGYQIVNLNFFKPPEKALNRYCKYHFLNKIQLKTQFGPPKKVSKTQPLNLTHHMKMSLLTREYL
jgi:hypothetical protein